MGYMHDNLCVKLSESQSYVKNFLIIFWKLVPLFIELVISLSTKPVLRDYSC